MSKQVLEKMRGREDARGSSQGQPRAVGIFKNGLCRFGNNQCTGSGLKVKGRFASFDKEETSSSSQHLLAPNMRLSALFEESSLGCVVPTLKTRSLLGTGYSASSRSCIFFFFEINYCKHKKRTLKIKKYLLQLQFLESWASSIGLNLLPLCPFF